MIQRAIKEGEQRPMWEFYSEPKELYHHGIKGQKWGKRNGPPYPLSANKHNAVVKSAKKETGDKGKQGVVLEAVALFTAATAVNIIVQQSVFALARRWLRKSDAKKDEGHEIESLDALEKLRTLKSPQSAKEIAKKVNPEFDQSDPSTATNCPYCTLATELRYRGYDVTARHLSTGANCDKLYAETFKTPPPIGWRGDKSYEPWKNETTEHYNQRRTNDICSDVAKKSGPNSRGAISLMIPGYGMGHIFNYVVDSKGNVRFIDGQVGDDNYAHTFDDLPSTTMFNFARLDDRELAPKITSTVRTP